MEVAGATKVYVRKGIALFSGCRAYIRYDRDRGLSIQEDLDLPIRRLSMSVSDAELGGVLREVLLSSPGGPFKSWLSHFHKGMHHDVKVSLAYDPDANVKLAKHFGLTSTKTLFSRSRFIPVELIRGEVTLVPTWRGGAEFNDFRDDYPPKAPARLPFSASDAELGAALRDTHARSSG